MTRTAGRPRGRFGFVSFSGICRPFIETQSTQSVGEPEALCFQTFDGKVLDRLCGLCIPVDTLGVPFRIRVCVLASGAKMTAELALAWLKLQKRRGDRRKFFCPECGGNLTVHATKPPHFTHARSTLDHPQPEFCKLRTGGRTKTPPLKIIID